MRTSLKMPKGITVASQLRTFRSNSDEMIPWNVKKTTLKHQSIILINHFKGQGQSSRSKFLQNGLNTKQLAVSLKQFHPQTSSHLLSHLFVTHSGVARMLLKFYERKAQKAWVWSPRKRSNWECECSTISNDWVKTASKTVQPFDWIQTHRLITKEI